jgi:hypothetical protein
MTAGIVETMFANQVPLFVGKLDRAEPEPIRVAEAGKLGRQATAGVFATAATTAVIYMFKQSKVCTVHNSVPFGVAGAD